ncbi:hypothetical protein B4102_3453 [Heyndrickxia sporothermodurans]|uniref:Uncharacterized protein n=1 Tax=Heyndrickxia sporothermodurans TaxID=46224 RepID=A0A150KPA2_9BACI|nr:hypothetical protein B4102_3453 [Heyndrickxia sporothermodurans]
MKKLPFDNSRLLLKGAFILTIAATITKILSAVYRVPFQNIVGDIGFYIYQQVYPIYGLAIALTTYGFPVIISKLVAEAEATKEMDSRQIVYISFLLLGIFGLFTFLFVFFGSDFIAGWMGDKQLTSLIKIVSFSFLLVPFISTIRGYFQGKGNMMPTAISQVQEQFIRVIFILLLASILVKNGSSLYKVGSGTVFSSIIGSLAALMTLFIFYFRHKGSNVKFRTSGFTFVAKRLLIQGLAICISGALLILFQFVDSLNIYSLLVKSGMEIDQAKGLKGIYDRGQPLIQLGTVVATSFSLTLVPALTSSRTSIGEADFFDKIGLAIKISVIVGLGATVGIICIMEPTNIMLFSTNDGTKVLQVFSISILFSSMILTMSGILQGIGLIKDSAIYVLIGVAVKYFGNYLFIPKYGTIGASLSTVIALIVILVLCIYKLKKMGIQLLAYSFYAKVIVSALFMAFILHLWTALFFYFNLTSRLWSTINALGGVMVGGIVYLFMVKVLKLLNEKELGSIPFGKHFKHTK